MTNEDRKVWLDILKPGDEVVYSERTADSLFPFVIRAKVVAVHPDCIVVHRHDFYAHDKDILPLSGERLFGRTTCRIDPMTAEARRRFGDEARRDWIKANMRGRIANLASEDLRRVADILGYKEGEK